MFGKGEFVVLDDGRALKTERGIRWDICQAHKEVNDNEEYLTECAARKEEAEFYLKYSKEGWHELVQRAKDLYIDPTKVAMFRLITHRLFSAHERRPGPLYP